MSQEIINVLNYIGEKIGIAIDWTADNVWPQVLDILGRYRIFQIVGLSIWMLFFVLVVIGIVYFGKIFVSKYKSCYNDQTNNLWFHYDSYYRKPEWCAPSYIYTVCLALGLMALLIGIPIVISEMLEWILIPEIQYLNMLRGYMQ